MRRMGGGTLAAALLFVAGSGNAQAYETKWVTSAEACRAGETFTCLNHARPERYCYCYSRATMGAGRAQGFCTNDNRKTAHLFEGMGAWTCPPGYRQF